MLSDLPTLGEMNARPRECKKGPDRLDRKLADTRDEKTQEAEWRKAVIARDKGKCRVCGKKTIVTLELDPKRRECHHIARKSIKVTRWDVRNGICTCFTCHTNLTRHRVNPIQVAALLFTASDGATYIDATHPITFVRTA